MSESKAREANQLRALERLQAGDPAPIIRIIREEVLQTVRREIGQILTDELSPAIDHVVKQRLAETVQFLTTTGRLNPPAGPPGGIIN